MAKRTRQDVIDSLQLNFIRLIRINSSRTTFMRHSAAAGGPDLTQPGYVLLRTLENGPLAMGELARRAHMDVGMATRQITRLEKGGLAQREPNPANRNYVRAVLTPTGQKAAEALREVRARHLQAALSGWSQEDLTTLDRLVERFLDDTSSTPFTEG